MEMTQKAAETAWHNLVQRIDRYLAGFDRVRRQPNRREGYYARQALEQLEAGLFAESTESLIKAVRADPLPAHIATMPETNRPATVEELRAELARLTLSGS